MFFTTQTQLTSKLSTSHEIVKLTLSIDGAQPREEKSRCGGKNPPKDLHPPTPSPEDISMEDNADAPVTTRALGLKRKAGNLTENHPSRQSPRLYPAANQNENLSPQPSPKQLPAQIKLQPPKRMQAPQGCKKPCKKRRNRRKKKQRSEPLCGVKLQRQWTIQWKPRHLSR